MKNLIDMKSLIIFSLNFLLGIVTLSCFGTPSANMLKGTIDNPTFKHGYGMKLVGSSDSLGQHVKASIGRSKSYSIVEANYIGINYMENLLDMRTNITSYTHLGAEQNNADAWHLHFPDDAARFLEGIAWESDYSPVVRLELARRISKGLMGSQVPGTKAYYYFRHRIGGKTEAIFGSEKPEDAGRLTLSNLGDAQSEEVKISFRAKFEEQWYDIERFEHVDIPIYGGRPPYARSPLNWNVSPYSFVRDFNMNGKQVSFTGTYWMSDEDMPLLFQFRSQTARQLEAVIGDINNPMPLLASGNGQVPGIITLPDRCTKHSDRDGDVEIINPGFNYLILSKNTAWAAPGYSSALLIIWEGKADAVSAKAKNGYGEVRVRFGQENNGTQAKVWLYPFPILNPDDMEYVYRNAEYFLNHGKLLSNTFPPQQMLNAIPAGLAAGAYVLSKFNDPTAPTVLARAMNAVDVLYEAEISGKKLARVFFPVRAAAWLVKTGNVINDQQVVEKYSGYLDVWLKRMLSAKVGYDGKGWPSGWFHFNAAKSLWLTYDATGAPWLKDAVDRALSVYTIDSEGIYRYGVKMSAPGGFETYFGSMPVGFWGLAGKTDMAQQLLELDVPAELGSKVTVRDMWHDAGNGPWAQDDANPEYVGASLNGLNIPQNLKFIIPVGAFPTYDEFGKVAITRKGNISNPFFMPGRDKIDTIVNGTMMPQYQVMKEAVIPGDRKEHLFMKRKVGEIYNSLRTIKGNEDTLVYQFDIKGAEGAAIDLDISGYGYDLSVSPDGTQWYKCLDTWSDGVVRQSCDVSFLTGCWDELVKVATFTPQNDEDFLMEKGHSTVNKDFCRIVAVGQGFVYKLPVKWLVKGYLELFLGNRTHIEISSDGANWEEQQLISNADTIDGSTWIHLIDVTSYLKDNEVIYVRVSNVNQSKRTAFLKRLTIYGVLKSESLFVRIMNVGNTDKHVLNLEKIQIRKWISN